MRIGKLPKKWQQTRKGQRKPARRNQLRSLPLNAIETIDHSSALQNSVLWLLPLLLPSVCGFHSHLAAQASCFHSAPCKICYWSMQMMRWFKDYFNTLSTNMSFEIYRPQLEWLTQIYCYCFWTATTSTFFPGFAVDVIFISYWLQQNSLFLDDSLSGVCLLKVTTHHVHAPKSHWFESRTGCTFISA